MAIGRLPKGPKKNVGSSPKPKPAPRPISKPPPRPINRAPAAPAKSIGQASKQSRSASSSGGGDSGYADSFGEGTGGYSAGGMGGLMSSGTGTLAPAMPTDAEWQAGDTSYQAQLAALQKALDDYKAQDGQARTAYETDYGVNTANLARAKAEGLAGQENDFASRGMINSGLFGQARGDMEADYGRRGDEMTRGRTNWLNGRETALGNFEAEQNLTKQQALQDSLARRAVQYGGGLIG